MSPSSPAFSQKLAELDSQALAFNRGIEREGLRVDAAGNLARTPHPEVFGSKLCHPLITTDFSESQLELITPVSSDLKETFSLLERIHRVINRGMADEILWAASMPCVLQGDPTIPLANYGESNLGRLKRTYRNGLGNRYGRSMQTICAVHYNFSFPEAFWQALAAAENCTNDQSFRNRRYFDLIRNFRKFGWLLIYLFGASPAVCNSFVKGRDHQLVPFDEGSLHLPHATSLRSGNLGYQSDAQAANLKVGYNDIESYVRGLAKGVTHPYPEYQNIGVKSGDIFNQLNDCILQSEAEFYSAIRAKRVAPAGANFLATLLEDGVEYIEVRLMDLDPFEPLGISQETVRFLDTFLLYCILNPSAEQGERCDQQIKNNMTLTVHRGREPGLQLADGDDSRTLTQWATSLLTEMSACAAHLDGLFGTDSHSSSLKTQQQKVADPEQTPSAKILATMKNEQIPFFRFAMNQSIAHKQTHLEGQLSADEEAHFADLAQTSIDEQQGIDAQAEISFDDYLKQILDAYPKLVSQL